MFTFATIGYSCLSQEWKNPLQLGQKIGGGLDIAAIISIAMCGVLVLTGYGHLPGLSVITNQTAQIMLGVAGGVFVIDLIALCLYSLQRGNQLLEQFEQEKHIISEQYDEKISSILNSYKDVKLETEQDEQDILEIVNLYKDVRLENESLRQQLEDLQKHEIGIEEEEPLNFSLLCSQVGRKRAVSQPALASSKQGA